MKSCLAAVLSCTGALLFAGCASAPAEHFYTLLVPSEVAADGNAASGHALTVTIASLTLPEAVDRPEFVIRTGADRVTVMESRRWSESLKSAIPRAVADDLGPLLGGAIVSVRSDSISGDAEYLVSIDVTRFDSTLNDAATIEAFWSIRPASGGKAASGKSSFRMPVQGDGFDELVAAHVRALAGLSGEIAAHVKIMDAARH